MNIFGLTPDDRVVKIDMRPEYATVTFVSPDDPDLTVVYRYEYRTADPRS